ncbi:hypothetical protein ACHHYP_20411 [Achlya hypogyna]|uniref:DDE-1 domain-containing protein n=1 Tax=Achlya hypogyna TaxID=1202772 RepID=A0A1V9YNI4_ACHHY|nr:hypothetical protein ACHHYP_20411 [Achlya hypogyna]
MDSNVLSTIGITRVLNADQTAINFEYLPTKTLNKKGAKGVCIRSAGREKARLTAMLMADTNGTKYPPFIIVKMPPAKVPAQRSLNFQHRLGFGRRTWPSIEAYQDGSGYRIYANRAGAYMRSAISGAVVGQPFKLLPPSREDVIGWVVAAWEALPKRAIVGGFAKAHIVYGASRASSDGDRVENPTRENSQERNQVDIDTLVDGLVAVGAMNDNDALTAEDDIFDFDELTNTEAPNQCA